MSQLQLALNGGSSNTIVEVEQKTGQRAQIRVGRNTFVVFRALKDQGSLKNSDVYFVGTTWFGTKEIVSLEVTERAKKKARAAMNSIRRLQRGSRRRR